MNAQTKPKPQKQRSALDIQQVFDDLDAILESSQPLGKAICRTLRESGTRRTSGREIGEDRNE